MSLLFAPRTSGQRPLRVLPHFHHRKRTFHGGVKYCIKVYCVGFQAEDGEMPIFRKQMKGLATIVVTVSEAADRQGVINNINSHTEVVGLTVNAGTSSDKEVILNFAQPDPSVVVEFKDWLKGLSKVAKVQSTVDSAGWLSVKPETVETARRAVKVSLRTFIGALVGVPGSDAVTGRAVTLSTFTSDALIAALIAAVVAGVSYVLKD